MKDKKKPKQPTQGSLFDTPFTALPKGLQQAKLICRSTVWNPLGERKPSKCYPIAVQQDGMKLADVPDDFKTPEICLAAVRNNRFAFQFVPEKFKSIEVCVASLRVGWFNLPNPYEHIPEGILHAEEFWDMAMQRLYLDAVKISGTKLERVPEKGRTPEVCLIAVQRWGRALQFVPGKLKTPELCLAAVRQDNRAISYVPKKYFFRLYSNGMLQLSKISAIVELQKISKRKLSASD